MGWVIYTKVGSGEFLVFTLPSFGFSTQTTNLSGRTPFVSGLVLRVSIISCLKFEGCFSFPKVWEMQLSSPAGQKKISLQGNWKLWCKSHKHTNFSQSPGQVEQMQRGVPTSKHKGTNLLRVQRLLATMLVRWGIYLNESLSPYH